MENRNIVNDLMRPESYPWQPDSVELIETHISWVFLAGDRVVKVKRPVVFPFVDHTTLASRHQSCLDEVRLNRRLTDGVYLDVVPIVQTQTGVRVGGEGTPVEWATLMRRLPADGMLDVLLTSGVVPGDLAARLAARLIPFHRDIAPECGRTPGVAAAATRIVTDNLDELTPFTGAPLGPIQLGLVVDAMRRFISERDEVLRARAMDGWIREGHGDLRAEHVCLEPDGTVQIFDCVEFNRDVRCAVVASDLGFLLMDLTRLDAPQIATTLLARYRATGIDLPDELLRFYTAHRALVRAKIACLGLTGASPEASVGLAVKSADYLDLATASAVTMRPTLVAMTGLSGTGKSTIARRLARAFGARRFASDDVRKDLAGIKGAAPAPWGEGIYRLEWTRATYDRLFALAEAHLSAGASVVLDASFLVAEQREHAAAVAARSGARLVLVETICDEETVAARLATRAQRGDSPSDATMATYLRQHAAMTANPPRVPHEAVMIQVNTATGLAGVLDSVLSALVEAGVVRPVLPSVPVIENSPK
jgi:aminoglycoside phosphotransferase family enzyme/predicted kinase